MNDFILVPGMLGGIAGCVAVALGRPYLANLIWLLTNPFMVWRNLAIGEWGQASLWIIYVCIAGFGVLNTRKKNGKT